MELVKWFDGRTGGGLRRHGMGWRCDMGWRRHGMEGEEQVGKHNMGEGVISMQSKVMIAAS